MFNVLIKLQRKPEPVRRRITFFAAVSVTGVIVALWLVSLSVRVPRPLRASVLQSAPEEKSPLRVLSETVGAFVSDTEAAVQALREGFSPTVDP